MDGWGMDGLPPTFAGSTTRGVSFSARPGVSSGTGSPGREASSRSDSAAPPSPSPLIHPPTLAGSTTKGFSFSARPGVSSGTGSPGREASSESGSTAPPLPPAAGALAGGGFLTAAAVGSSGGFSGRLSTCRCGGWKCEYRVWGDCFFPAAAVSSSGSFSGRLNTCRSVWWWYEWQLWDNMWVVFRCHDAVNPPPSPGLESDPRILLGG